MSDTERTEFSSSFLPRFQADVQAQNLRQNDLQSRTCRARHDNDIRSARLHGFFNTVLNQGLSPRASISWHRLVAGRKRVPSRPLGKPLYELSGHPSFMIVGPARPTKEENFRPRAGQKKKEFRPPGRTKEERFSAEGQNCLFFVFPGSPSRPSHSE